MKDFNTRFLIYVTKAIVMDTCCKWISLVLSVRDALTVDSRDLIS